MMRSTIQAADIPAHNLQGIVLVSSKQPNRIAQNAKIMDSPAVIEAGKRLITALANEKNQADSRLAEYNHCNRNIPDSGHNPLAS